VLVCLQLSHFVSFQNLSVRHPHVEITMLNFFSFHYFVLCTCNYMRSSAIHTVTQASERASENKPKPPGRRQMQRVDDSKHALLGQQREPGRVQNKLGQSIL